MSTDRFGNAYAPGLPYAHGRILPNTEDDFRKLQEAWRHIAARVRAGGPEAIFNFSGLEHGLPLSPDELPMANDFVAPALYFDQFKQAALEHFGGSPEQHDVALFNRLTGATYATHLTLVKPGDVVIGAMAGEKSLVSRIRARAFEMGLEARPLLYPAAVRSLVGSTAERVQELVDTTREVAAAIKDVLGDRLHETPMIAELLADDILDMALERTGLRTPPIVPYEASAALAMLLLRDYGIITVHFVGLPPGTSALMFKFIAPEVLKRFGGAQAYAQAIDESLNKLANMLTEPEQIHRLLLGNA